MTLSLPKKTREIDNNHMDSTVWNEFNFRPDDIIIATYAKSGTTWTQQIVSQLIFGGAEDVNVAEISPWLDLRIIPREVKLPLLEAQTHRRIVKTHLPLDAFVFRPDVKHIYIGRDGRDVMWSMHNHHINFTPEIMQEFHASPAREGPPLKEANPDPRAYFLEWLEDRGFPVWSLWENVRTWRAARHLPNVKVLHFNDLKTDPEGEIRAIADFLEIDVAPDAWPAIFEHCSFEYMKRNAAKVAPLGGDIFKGGGETFINKGMNGRWRDVLTEEDCARYEARAIAELGEAEAAWLKYGKAGAPAAA